MQHDVYADADLDALRAELKEMKTSYEARIQALEARLQKAERNAADAAPQAETTAQPTTASSVSSRFNPDISLILQGRYANLDDIEHRHISGFVPAGHDHGADRGFSLDHTELVMSASIDPYFRGYFNLALIDEEAEIEEAWFQTSSLGNGLSLKGGRFLSGIGYQNEEDTIPEKNRITNNYVHDCGAVFLGACGIWVGFARETVVAHNFVHGPRPPGEAHRVRPSREGPERVTHQVR